MMNQIHFILDQSKKIYESVASDSPIRICNDPKDKTSPKFRLRNSRIVLTYLTHINKDEYMEFIATKKFSIELCLILNENSYKKRGYDHTTVYLKLFKIRDTRNPKYFDFKGLSPVINVVTTNAVDSKVIQYHKYHEYHEDADTKKMKLSTLNISDDTLILTGIKSFISELSSEEELEFIKHLKIVIKDQSWEIDVLFPKISTNIELTPDKLKPDYFVLDQTSKIYESVESDSPIHICSEPKDKTSPKFRVQNSRIVLTYLTHIDNDEYLRFITAKKLSVELCLVLNENSRKKHGCDHTTVYLKLSKLMDTIDSKYFDFNGLSPVINVVATNAVETKVIQYYKDTNAKKMKLPNMCKSTLSISADTLILTKLTIFMSLLSRDEGLTFIGILKNHFSDNSSWIDYLFSKIPTMCQDTASTIAKENKRIEEEQIRLDDNRLERLVETEMIKRVKRELIEHFVINDIELY